MIVSLNVNGKPVTVDVEPRTSLADALREELRLTGTHLGCEHGACGACTVMVDEQPVRSCIALAVSCQGVTVRTVEGLDDDVSSIVKESFSVEHGLQCGFCTSGMLVTALDIVQRLPDATDDDIRIELSGNLCRCTGYVNIVRAVRRALEKVVT